MKVHISYVILKDNRSRTSHRRNSFQLKRNETSKALYTIPKSMIMENELHI